MKFKDIWFRFILPLIASAVGWYFNQVYVYGIGMFFLAVGAIWSMWEASKKEKEEGDGYVDVTSIEKEAEKHILEVVDIKKK